MPYQLSSKRSGIIHGTYDADSAAGAVALLATEKYGCDYDTAISNKLINPSDLVVTMIKIKK